VIDVQQPAVPERLIAYPHLYALVEINGYAEPAQGRIALRTPGTAGLSVAHGLRPEDSLQVRHARRLAPLELLRAFHEAHVEQVLGRRRMHAVPVGMAPDRVFGEGRDHVLPVPALECTRLLADDLEGCAHACGGQIAGDAQCG